MPVLEVVFKGEEEAELLSGDCCATCSGLDGQGGERRRLAAGCVGLVDEGWELHGEKSCMRSLTSLTREGRMRPITEQEARAEKVALEQGVMPGKCRSTTQK